MNYDGFLRINTTCDYYVWRFNWPAVHVCVCVGCANQTEWKWRVRFYWFSVHPMATHPFALQVNPLNLHLCIASFIIKMQLKLTWHLIYSTKTSPDICYKNMCPTQRQPYLPRPSSPYLPVLDASSKGFKSNTVGSCLLAVCHCTSFSGDWETGGREVREVEVKGKRQCVKCWYSSLICCAWGHWNCLTCTKER